MSEEALECEDCGAQWLKRDRPNAQGECPYCHKKHIHEIKFPKAK